jgi:hypothetical protein
MYTSKLEGMFKDMTLSKEILDDYKRHCREADGGGALGGVELVTHVLTTGYWPTQKAPPCDLPPQIKACCEDFEKYYCELRHKGRRLNWQTNMVSAPGCAAPRRKRRFDAFTPC